MLRCTYKDITAVYQGFHSFILQGSLQSSSEPVGMPGTGDTQSGTRVSWPCFHTNVKDCRAGYKKSYK